MTWAHIRNLVVRTCGLSGRAQYVVACSNWLLGHGLVAVSLLRFGYRKGATWHEH